MGRSTGKLQAAEGRRNCVWGDMHIVLPAGTPMYAVNPRTETRNYVVRAFDSTLGAPNDTLAGVAQRFHTTPERILAVNGKKATDAGTWWPRVTGSEHNALRKPAPTIAQRTIRVPAVYGAAASTPPDDLTPDVWARWTVQPIGHTKAPLIVSLSEARGTITLTTRNASGEWIGSEAEAEGAYKLYKTATDTYPGCPSAGYEMLRFGRILGPDAPAATDLHEGRLPHFRKVAVDANARAFVDLNRAGVKVYSDADFPHWLGWTFIDDDTDGNSRCDSMQLLDLIEPRASTPHSGEGTHGTAVVIDAATEHRGRLMLAYAKTQTGELRDRLTYCVVKMPTEWARDDFDKRWGWLPGTEGTTPVSNSVSNVVFPMCLGEPAYQRFKRHHQALAFWEEAVTNGLGLKTEHYHFHPMRFIDVFKKCGWLSLREQAQLLPRSSMPDAGGANLSWNESRKRFLSGNQLGLVTSPPGLGLAINYTFRKYGFNTSLRQAHFLAQCFKESGALKWTAELGSSAYFRKMYEVYTPEEAASDFDNRREWLAAMGFLKGRGRLAYIAQRPQEIRDKALGGGNTQIGDGARFRGRGLIHLTWRNGYRDYGKYRNLDFTTDPNPERVQSDAEVAADTAGYFWSMRKIHSRADQGATNEDVKRCFSLVGGAGGLAERQQFFRYVYFILNDFPSMPIESGLKRQLEV